MRRDLQGAALTLLVKEHRETKVRVRIDRGASFRIIAPSMLHCVMSHPSTPSQPPVRLVMRFLLEFMIGMCPLLARRHGSDIVRGILFLTIAQANRPRFAEIVRYDTPTTALRAISVNALAQSIGLPYETARRHVLALTRAGICVREPQGIVVPNSVITSPVFDDFSIELHALFLRMMRRLKAVGFDFDDFGPATPEPLPPDQDSVRPDAAVRHVVIDFVLRMSECGRVAHENDMVRSLVFTAIMSANAAPYTLDNRAWKYASLAQSPPERERLPISVSSLAKLICMPYETTRRYVEQMIADKDIVRVKGQGVINPQVSPRDALLHQSGTMVMSRFVQLVSDLKRLGFSFETLDMGPHQAAERAARKVG
ncbi:MAG: hypothetical protein JO167_06925 [Alphaproteobacteria bacterium]|nr:hypothetical protein [Alphaproteobacteria bacterium]MBV9903127.1 hypothetical protein [Alphaproteobacteria bacterium]